MMFDDDREAVLGIIHGFISSSVQATHFDIPFHSSSQSQ